MARGIPTTASLLAVLALPLPATTYVPPADIAELAAQSDAVVMAVAGASDPFARGALIFTDTSFAIETALAGPLGPGATIAVQVPGGEVDGRSWVVAGSPRFEPGQPYFLCLHEKEPGLWIPRMLSYGVLRETLGLDGTPLLAPVDGDGGGALPRPDGRVAERIGTYAKGPFLSHLAAVLRREVSFAGKAVEAPAGAVAPHTKAAPAECSFFESGGSKLRWHAFDTGDAATIYASDDGETTLASGGYPEVVEALNQWVSITGAGVNCIFGGPRQSEIACTGDQDAEANMIVFNDPCSDMDDLQNCTGVLAYGGPLVNGTHRFDNATWITIVGWIVVVNNGSGCIGSTNFMLMMAHELGHGLGFGHFEDAASMMYAYCCNRANDTDRLCVRYTYPPVDAANKRPTIGAGADRQIALVGNTAYVTGTATDDGVPATPGEVATAWRHAGGPGSVSFADAGALETRVAFPASGNYVLTLTGDDGELMKTDAVAMAVETNVGSGRTVTFQEGADGYSGTSDTYIAESQSTISHGSAAEVRVDGEDASGLRLEALLRFDALFGTEERQIPPGAAIRSARLELATSDAGTGARFYRLKESWDEGATWSGFGAQGIVVGQDTEANPDAEVAGADGTVAVDVTASLQAWSNDPCANFGWALLPYGTNGWVFSSSEGQPRPRLVVEFTIVPQEGLIAVGDTWRLFKGRTDPPANWKEVGFVPTASWLSAKTGIGYGDGDDATVLGDMSGSYVTFYCRREFTVRSAAPSSRLTLQIDYDDGFVAYLNGAEVARSASMGAPGTPVTRLTEADSREAGAAEVFELDPALLAAGANVLAIEVHNAGIDSSDCSFIPGLVATFNLIEGGDVWAFLRGSQPVPANWNELSFDDAAWERGPTGIGYADGDDETVLADMAGDYTSVFCRKVFEVPDPAALQGALLTIIYDDGIVAHLNGVEIGRANMPAGAVGPATAASSSIEVGKFTYTIAREKLRQGSNVLAVSVHNAALGGSDLSFIPVLVPLTARPGGVDCGPARLFRRGDANDDGAVDLADALSTLGFLFAAATAPVCPDAADANDDGATDLSDAIRVLQYLFGGNGTLPLPGAACGPDPTADTLGACAGTHCP